VTNSRKVKEIELHISSRKVLLLKVQSIEKNQAESGLILKSLLKEEVRSFSENLKNFLGCTKKVTSCIF
jgi:hypothetical protein